MIHTNSPAMYTDGNLFWNVHMDNLSKKVPSGTGALKQIRPFVNSNTLQMIL